jgi:hypothetical protein
MNEVFIGSDMKSTRDESKMASAIRLVQYPDGTQKLQGAYSWTQGFMGGVTWRDMPVVMVGISGQEFVDD